MEKEKEKEKEKESLFRVRFGGTHSNPHPRYFSLLRSIASFFPGKEIRVQNVLYIRASSVERLSDFLASSSSSSLSHYYMLSLNLIYCFTQQLRFLQTKENQSFYTLDPAKFVVLDRRILCYFSVEHLKDIRPDDHQLNIFSVIERKQPSFLCPVSFPASLFPASLPPYIVSQKCIYFSLAKLILVVFFQNDASKLKGSKLWAFLERAMDPNLFTRCLLFL